jgi:NTP pyrophosphatase (non-canonical NTP hydrolase)
MLDRLLHLVATQNEHRQTWSENDSPDSLARQIREEADELVHSISQYDVQPNGTYEVIGEIGDVLYLTLKLCADLGLDPAQAVELKVARNSAKYPDHFSSNGWSYEQAQALSRSLWQALGGDGAFYLWHSLYFPLGDGHEPGDLRSLPPPDTEI